MMQLKVLAVLLAVVAAASAHGHKTCVDGSTPSCACGDGTIIVQVEKPKKGGRGRRDDSGEDGDDCADGTDPTCTCADGSAPVRKSPCADGAMPTCPGKELL